MRPDAPIFVSITPKRGFQIGSSIKSRDTTQFLSGFVKRSLLLLLFFIFWEKI